ncbi:MAG: zinc dependent phospholipase C family protein, partial [Terriglobia bacterium]
AEAGRYELEDKAYAKLLCELAKRHFRSVSPALRRNILAFYGNLNDLIAAKQSPKKWRKALRELNALKTANVQQAAASR